jgi:hypothetical protein
MMWRNILVNDHTRHKQNSSIGVADNMERATKELNGYIMDIPMVQGGLLELDDAVTKEMEASILYSLLREDISWTVIA